MSTHLHSELTDDEVDVTNLIDLLVVLCALLMLLMPAITSFREIHGLPASDGDGPAAVAELASTPIVRFAVDGTYAWNDAPIAFEELSARRPDGQQTIYVAGDPQAPYGVSVTLRTALRSAGWTVKELAQAPRETSP